MRIWDAASGQELACLRGHEESVNRVSFSPDGERIVSGSRDKTVRVWDADTGECLQIIQDYGDVAAIAAGAKVFPWRALRRGLETVIEAAAAGKEIAWFPSALRCITTHPAGRTWAGDSSGYLCLFTLEGAAPGPAPRGG